MTNIDKFINLYLANNINIIAVNNNKKSVEDWKIYQTSRITPTDLSRQLLNHNTSGIAIICGAISGNLEVIDIDLKYDLTGKLYQDYISMLKPELVEKLHIVSTKSQGIHLYYRCEVIEGNKKLAQRHATEAEEIEGDKRKVLIETRGEAGYVVAPPTEGYTIIQEQTTIQTITPEERAQLHEAARSFNSVFNEEKKFQNFQKYTNGSTTTGVLPWTDYNERGIDHMLDLLEMHGWRNVGHRGDKVHFLRPGTTDSKSSGNYDFSKGWFSVFTTSSIFEAEKAYRPSDVFCVLNKITNGKDLYARLYELGYGERINTTGLKKEVVGQVENAPYIFWEINKKEITILPIKLISLCSDIGGFGLYYHLNEIDYKLVRVTNNFVIEARPEHIKRFIFEYIASISDQLDIEPEALKTAVFKVSDKLFSSSSIDFFNIVTLNFLKHTPDAAYFPFLNGVVKVTKDGRELLTYQQINMHVWNNHVIDAYYEGVQSLEECEFFKFIQLISNNDPQRITYVCTVIGYLLHRYKNPAKAYAILLAEETENEETGGGTGKGLFYKALAKMVRTVVMNGKNFKHDKSFLFQSVDLSTQLVVVDDCRKGIDFQGFYSHITEGLTVEKKNKPEFFIPFSESPSFLLSTNYSVNLEGNHGKRRVRTVEFSNFFHPSNTVEQHFGHLFFDGWSKEQYTLFYDFMMLCVSTYLEHGITEAYTSTTLTKKELKIRLTPEFLEFFESIDLGTANMFEDLYNGFLNESGYEKKEYSVKRFRTALVMACEKLNLTFTSRKCSWKGGKKEVVISGTKR